MLRAFNLDRRELNFVPRTPGRVGFENFRYRVSRATVVDDGSATLGTTLRRGMFSVVARDPPSEHVTVRTIWHEANPNP